MLENILFYIVFLGQIILISYYYPGKILQRIKHVLVTYPPPDYPKLYPKSLTYYETGQRLFRIINHIILILGLILLVVIALWDQANEGNVPEVIPAAYFMIQMIPLILMELTEFAFFKLMRKADIRTIRKAELLPRRLFDFVSVKMVALAIILYIACILFYINLHGFQLSWSNDAIIIIITVTISNMLFAGIIFWNLRGKKLNPHQATKDRLNQIGVTVKSLVFMSIAASMFLVIFETVDELQLDYLEPVLMSLYFQFIIIIGLGTMLRAVRIENLDFDVYKKMEI